jgi:uncharacterized membrane protein YeaQ/YmgE (transglycosylase-associated protein family)
MIRGVLHIISRLADAAHSLTSHRERKPLLPRLALPGGYIMSAESLLIILLVGGIAGWLAGLIVRGTGFGLVADIALGIVGAFIGSWLLPKLGIRIGTGLVTEIVVALIGALILLAILGLFARGGGVGMVLTPPSYPLFIISLLLAIVAAAGFYAKLRLPLYGFRLFDILAVAYAILLAGVIFRRL